MPQHFSRSLKTVRKDLDKRLARKVIRVTAAVHSELVASTPVDTGWARANWVPGLQQFKSSGVGKDVAGIQARAIHGLAQVISGYKAIKQGAVWIVNNVPYVRILDARHRIRQGFIARSIDKALLKVDGLE